MMTCWIRSLATDLFGRRQEQQQRSAGAYIKVHSRLAPRLSSSISEIVLFFLIPCDPVLCASSFLAGRV